MSQKATDEPSESAQDDASQDYESDAGADDDDKWNVDQFRDTRKIPLHNMQKNLSYIKRKCKKQLEMLNAMKGRENVDKTKYEEVVKAFVAAEVELTERRAFDTARCIVEIEKDPEALHGRGIHGDINTWNVEHFVARKKEEHQPYTQRREFSIFVDEDTVKEYKGPDETIELKYDSNPSVWLHLLHSVYTSLLYDSTQRAQSALRNDNKDVRQFIFLKETIGPSFLEALSAAAHSATAQEEHRRQPAAPALFPGISDTDIGPKSVTGHDYRFDSGGEHPVKYRIAMLSNRNTNTDEKMKEWRGEDVVNEKTSKFFNDKIAPHTECKWVELEFRLQNSTHFIRILRSPKKTNYVMVYPFFAAASDVTEGVHFRDREYNEVVNLQPYAVKTPWIPGGSVVARLSEVDTMVEAMQVIKQLTQRGDHDVEYHPINHDEDILKKIEDSASMKDDVRVYYSIQDEYFGQWTVWFVHYNAQIVGVQLYYPSTAMLHANKRDTRRSMYNVNGTPHKHWKTTPKTYISPLLDNSVWPSITVNVLSRWHIMQKLNGTYTATWSDDIGQYWMNVDTGMCLGTINLYPDTSNYPLYNSGENNTRATWAFYNSTAAYAYTVTDTPLNVTWKWFNFSNIPQRNRVRINLALVQLPLGVGQQSAPKGLAPHTVPDAHLGAVMESLGDIRRALNQVSLLKLE